MPDNKQIKARFKNISEVIQYLQADGWRISRTTAYEHWKTQGKLKANADGTFSLQTVINYAKNHLQKKDGTPGKGDSLAERKADAEVRKLIGAAKITELKYRKLAGELIEVSQLEIELAQRANDLINYLNAVARSAAGRMIKIVDGNMKKEGELRSWLLGMIAKAMDNYARPIDGLEKEED